MVKLTDHGMFLQENGSSFSESFGGLTAGEGRKRTIAYRILQKHNLSDSMDHLKIRFDMIVSPDNNYVNILQTARASGLKRFPVPYVLSNCHNTLCTVGGTINADDHVFALDCAKKYGGIFVSPYAAVIHQYMRERMAGCGKMILGSDSHTRYGALGTMGIGEGGGEIVKQLLSQTYDVAYPDVIGVVLTGTPAPGVGPMDVALAVIAKTFSNGFCKNKVLEFMGPGIANLSVEYRMGIDVMLTESATLSTIWETDEKTEEYLAEHGRGSAYAKLSAEPGAYYDGLIEVDLSAVECMIALPFHPSLAIPIRECKERLSEIGAEIDARAEQIQKGRGKKFAFASHIRNGELYADQALVCGCSGGMFENIAAIADILRKTASGVGLALRVSPASLPIAYDLARQGISGELILSGVTIGPSICGPCFGVTDIPADGQFSIRHVTRNYPNREGSRPTQGQMASSALMDARSIAATVKNGGKLTAATELQDVVYRPAHHQFNPHIYEKYVMDFSDRADPGVVPVKGPNIADWPDMKPLKKHLLLRAAGVYEGSLTTEEIIPSGEASSYRSNPIRLAEFTMVNRDPEYRKLAETVQALSAAAEQGTLRNADIPGAEELADLLEILAKKLSCRKDEITIGSLLASDQIGDGSSREQAASSQKVLGGFANLACEYSTKRYRSNLINWGILPLRTEKRENVHVGDYLLIRDVQDAVLNHPDQVSVELLNSADGSSTGKFTCTLDELTANEKQILLSGCLINFNRSRLS